MPLHRRDELVAAGGLREAELGVEGEGLEMVVVELAVGGMRAPPAIGAFAVLPLGRPGEALRQPVRARSDVPGGPVDEGLRRRRVRILDDYGEALRARRQGRPAE